MNRVVQLKDQLSQQNSQQCPMQSKLQPVQVQSKENATSSIAQKEIKLMDFKASKYHHSRELEEIKQILVDNVNLESMTPRMKIPEHLKPLLPENYKKFLSHFSDWGIMKDGEEHKRIRRAFPSQLMQYNLSFQQNYVWISEMVENIVQQKWFSFQKIKELDFHHEISAEVAVQMLCFLLGFKNPSSDLKKKLILWSDTSADTGGRYDENFQVNSYLEGHDFFLETIEKVKQALKENDESCFDLQKGVLAKLVKEQVITDKDSLANQIQMFVLGGSHNPANLISLSVGLLLENKEQYLKLREKIKQNPSESRKWVHRVTNETLRLRPPAQVIVRSVKCPYSTKNFTAKPGEAIIIHLEESTRKNNEMQDPTRYDLFRENENSYKHMGFGFGHHRCMGGETGQLCAEAVLERMILCDLVETKSLQKRDFSQIQIKKFKWVESSSFKEIQEFIVTF